MLASGFLDLEPVDHDGILELDSKLSSVFFLLVVMHDMSSLRMLEIMRLAETVLDYVIEGRFLGIWVHKIYLNSSKSLIKLNMFLSEILYGVNIDIKH